MSSSHFCKKVTLDSDGADIVAHKVGAKWTGSRHKGFMPRVGTLWKPDRLCATAADSVCVPDKSPLSV